MATKSAAASMISRPAENPPPLLPAVGSSTIPPTAGPGVGVGVMNVFVIVQLAGAPSLIGTVAQSEEAAYPEGTVSDAVHVVPDRLKCVTVATNGDPGAAIPEEGVTVPLVQPTVTATGVSGPLGE